MKKVFVFCIGGTGIRVMKSIIMLMASGMDTNGYKIVPVIIDPHLDLEEKKNLLNLISNYVEIYKKATQDVETLNPLGGFFTSELITLGMLDGHVNDNYQFAGSNEMFRSYINASNLDVNDINNFFIETLFSTKNLNSALSVGFKGNPNVGTVVLGERIEKDDWYKGFKTQFQDGDRVMIISSIFGGTGASGYPLLEKKIRRINNNEAIKKVVMGAVTVMPYYALRDPSPTNSDIDSSNFFTKTRAALAYYENTVESDYLYYIGEKQLRQVFDNDEKKQEDTAHFIELIAATALFDFLKREKPEKTQYLTRAIEDDKESMSLKFLGSGYKDVIKCVADYMLLSQLIVDLPNEWCFPLSKSRDFNESFYKDSSFQKLKSFSDSYKLWYQQLSTNKRAFAPLHIENPKKMNGWIRNMELDAKNDSYYLLQMIKASNAKRVTGHSNKFRLFLELAYEAIDFYTKKIEL